MSIYSNVTEQDLVILRKLAEQQKNQRDLKIKNRILKQTLDIRLAESLTLITKKLEEVNKSTKKLGDVLKESKFENENYEEIVPVEIDSDNSEGDNKRALPNSSILSELMPNTLGSLLSSYNSLRIKPSPYGPTILGVPIYTLGGDKLRIRDNVYELKAEIYKALSCTGYTGKTMKKENDILMLNKIIKDLGYTGFGDRESKQKTFFTKTLPKLVNDIHNRTFEEFDLEGRGIE